MQHTISSKLYNAFLAALVFCTLAAARPAAAQGYFHWNPADPVLPFSSEINPALVSKHFSQVAVGLQVFHYGFLDQSSMGLRENRLNFSFPYLMPLDLAIGFDVRYFSANLYNELAAAFLLSRKLTRGLSIGAKFALERRGFNSAQFQGVDFSDPLLAGGLSHNNFNLGLGAHYQTKNFNFGLGIDHLNQPLIGEFDADAIVPMEMSAAIGYRLGMLTPMLLMHDDGDTWRMGFTIVAHHSSWGALRMGYEQQMPFRIEASLNLSRNSSMGYAVDMPGEGTRSVSAGSHQLYYKQILGREPELAQPDILFSDNSLNLLEKTVVRQTTDALHLTELAAIDEILPGYLSTGRSTDDLMIVVAGALSSYETQAGMAERYRRIRERINVVYDRNPEVQVVLRADRQTLPDATRLKMYIEQHKQQGQKKVVIAKIESAGTPNLSGFMPGKATVERLPLTFSAEKLTIRLPAPGKTRKTKGWKLTFRNAAGAVVKSFAGDGKLPAEIEWDWRDDDGQLIAPGEYIAHLKATTVYDNERVAVQGPLKVVLKKRKVFLKFGSEPQQTNKPAATPATFGLGQ